MKNDETLSAYLKEVRSIPLLNFNEEGTLIRKAQAGDNLAREKVIKANLRIVIKCAKAYKGSGLDLLDLINEGNIGLMKALDHYDVNKGYHFISYAVWWIRQAITAAITEKGSSIRLPASCINDLRKVKKVFDNNKEIKEEEKLEEASRTLNKNKNYIKHIMNMNKTPISLDSEVAGSSYQDKTPLYSFIEDKSAISPEREAENKNVIEIVNTVLKELNVKEEQVIKMRYGFNGNEPLSLSQIGGKLNLSKERIRQIEARAITKLQEPAILNRLDKAA